MTFTLDDAHEALAGIHHILIARENVRMSDQDVTLAWALAADACHAIEAQLPEPCEHCGSDECRQIRWPSSENRLTPECQFSPVTITFEDGR